jgi:hypothetical protein
MTDLDVSVVNSKKLDDLDLKIEKLDKKIDHSTQLLEGDGADAPGLLSRVAGMERILFGQGQEDHWGMVQKVNVLWRMHVWVLCTMSAGAGFALREVVKVVWKI